MTIIFIILAAICNALMDVLENENFLISRFRNLSRSFWYKRESWKTAKKIFGWKLDAWHIAKSLMIIFLVLSIIFYRPFIPVFDFCYLGILWICTFNFFYNKVLK